MTASMIEWHPLRTGAAEGLSKALYALAGVFTATAIFLAVMPKAPALDQLVRIYMAICSTLPGFANTVNAIPGERPKSIVTVVSSEDIGGGDWLTVQRVQYPPRAFTPKHVHAGVIQAYVTKGVLRSHVSGQPPGEFAMGGTFHEARGAIHFYVENPSVTEWAELLAIQVHPKGAPLTTFVD